MTGRHAAGLLILCIAALPGAGRGQLVTDAEPRAPLIEREMEEIAEEPEELFLQNRVPPLAAMNRVLDRAGEISPIKFNVQSAFLSDWLDEGANGARRGLQIQQVYSAEYAREFGPFSAGVGFEYFQIDTTGAVPGPSTVERDFTIYLPLGWKVLSVAPSWTYIRYPEEEEWRDTGELGVEVCADLPLNPRFLWNYDYDKGRGSYLEWGISHNVPLRWGGEKLAVFTPSMALGMNSHKYIDRTTLTHIDWGLDLSVPLNHHFVVTGLLHFTKSLTRMEDEDGARLFENIVPWAGLVLTMEF
ncbi:MAG: hypothetical protein PHN82_09320 [bacterium]|nr:hypothetical protein [bacterium]